MSNQLNLIRQKLSGWLDRLNDCLTPYRLMLYFLLALVGWAVVGSFFKEVPYSWHEILVSASWLMAVCWTTNKLVSGFLDIPANKESDLITALILALILTPPSTTHDFALAAAAGIAAISSKYIITAYRSHIFNPAAAGAFVAGEILHKYPSWWIGTKFMTPLIIIGGILVLRKMKRFTMVGAFLAIYILYLIYGARSGGSLHFLWLEIVATPVLFFAVVMLIEPLTSPTTASKYLPYTLIVGLLYSITKLKFSPEDALLIGNLFTLLVAANRRYQLRFIGKTQEAAGIYSYAFAKPQRFSFTPGQYMEWAVAQSKTDGRGNRRYLTISSSPTERGLMFTVKYPDDRLSAFKQKIDELKPGETILAGHLAGNFTLPKDQSQKIALMAGGVGITPFRSMVKYLIDKGEGRDMALVYSASSPAELSFQKLFSQAAAFGLTTHYVTEGYVDEPKIKSLLPDFTERLFYISGPYSFIQAVEAALLRLSISPSQITTDYFPGYG